MIRKQYEVTCDRVLTQRCRRATVRFGESKKELRRELQGEGWEFERNSCYGDGPSDPEFLHSCPECVSYDREDRY